MQPEEPRVTTRDTLVPDLQASLAERGALVPVGHQDAPLPVFQGRQMVQALTAYRELQTALDKAMPDQLMTLDGKAFRKKGYWRALSVAFNLTVEPVSEQRTVSGDFGDGRPNFGYVVTYRATAPNGRTITGDGACFAVEKAKRFKCPHPHPKGWKGKSAHWPHDSCPDFDPEFQWRTLPAQATEHNIRSHAHTRAFNRAVSNLVGFGEVSAEEVERGEAPPEDFMLGEVGPPADEPQAPPVVKRITLPPDTFQIVTVRTLRYGGEVLVVDEHGLETVYPTPDRQCVELCEALLQEAVPVTLDRVKGKRDGVVKLKGAHRWKSPDEQKRDEENKALDAELVARQAAHTAL